MRRAQNRTPAKTTQSIRSSLPARLITCPPARKKWEVGCFALQLAARGRGEGGGVTLSPPARAAMLMCFEKYDFEKPEKCMAEIDTLNACAELHAGDPVSRRERRGASSFFRPPVSGY